MRASVRTLASYVIVAAAAGFALAHYASTQSKPARSALDRQAALANFKLEYPSTWRLEPSSASPKLPLSDELALSSPQATGAAFVIGTAHPASPGTMPPALRTGVPASAKPELISLGGSSFYRYLSPSAGRASESIYLLPTTSGTVTAVCSAQTSSLAFLSDCERVLATLRLTSGSTLSFGVDAGYALSLNRILTQLNAVRRSAGPGLRAAVAATRSRAASALAGAHAQAAAAANALTGVGVSVVNPPLVAALQRSASAYRALAAATTSKDSAAYGRAEAALASAARALGAVYVQLRRFGYRVG